jgi:hypothetical protein
VNSYNDITWTNTNHDLDFVFEKEGIAYGIEVKNTLGYMDVKEFVTKIRVSLHLGLKPVFAVRSLPRTWAEALIQAGGYAMIMQYQFYPWNHMQLASEIREKLLLPVDTPRRIEDGTMQCEFTEEFTGIGGQLADRVDRFSHLYEYILSIEDRTCDVRRALEDLRSPPPWSGSAPGRKRRGQVHTTGLLRRHEVE